MARKYSIGLLILLPLSLYLIYRKLTGTGNSQPNNVPPNFLMLMQNQFQSSRFKNLLNYWLSIAKMETAGFTSGLYLNGNNPWGMKIPEIRKTTAQGRQYGVTGRYLAASLRSNPILSNSSAFASYPTLSAGVADILLYMEAMNYPENIPDLLSFVQVMKSKGYFGSETVDSYYQKVKAWQKR